MSPTFLCRRQMSAKELEPGHCHRVNDFGRVGSGQSLFMSRPASLTRLSTEQKKTDSCPQQLLLCPEHMTVLSWRRLSMRLHPRWPGLRINWRGTPLLQSSNDPLLPNMMDIEVTYSSIIIQTSMMIGNYLQISDTDFYDRSCWNLRHEARVVNQTCLRFTIIDMHIAYDITYLWVCWVDTYYRAARVTSVGFAAVLWNASHGFRKVNEKY